MTALVADITHRQHSLGAQRMLYANAVLVAYRQLVIVHIQAGDAGSVNRLNRSRASRQGDAGIFHRDAVQTDLQAEGDVSTGVVHVVALDAFVHDAESAADNGFAASRDVIRKAKARTKSGPMVVHEALRYTVLARNADAVQIERHASENGIRAGTEAGTGGGAARVCGPAADTMVGVESGGIGRVVKGGIEVTHAVVGFVSMRHAVPAQAEVKRQPTVDAPIVLNISGPGNIVPVAV